MHEKGKMTESRTRAWCRPVLWTMEQVTCEIRLQNEMSCAGQVSHNLPAFTVPPRF